MFTGITTDVGTVASADRRANADLRLTIRCGYDLSTVDLGASIACSGVCLTVVDKGDDWFAVDVSAETLSKTAGNLWNEGAQLNLERSLRIGDELGGHLVSGHVDGIAEVIAVRPEAGSSRVDLRAPAALGPFLAPKGSITLDGVSLTVNDVRDSADGTEFSVNIIPHTAERTTFVKIEPGRQFNVEIDVISRYLQRLVASNAQAKAQS